MSTQSINKRAEKDRRDLTKVAKFPLRRNNIVVVSHDRRVRCERRVNHLEVGESKISKELFMNSLEKMYGKRYLPENNKDNDFNDNNGIDIYKSYYNLD